MAYTMAGTNTNHTYALWWLPDQIYTFYVACNDPVGNVMTSPQSLQIKIDTRGNYAITRPSDLYNYFEQNKWNQFHLSLARLQNRISTGTLANTNVSTVMASVAGNYTLLYWYNSTGSSWLSYEPGGAVNSLANFTDDNSVENYHIYVTAANERIEIA
jgi:hypothetical protein